MDLKAVAGGRAPLLQMKSMMRIAVLSSLLVVVIQAHISNADKPMQCGPGLNNLCPNPSLCCNYRGKCGSTASDCGDGCQSGNCFFTRLGSEDLSSKAAQIDEKDNQTQCGPGLQNPCPDPRFCCNYKGKCGISESDCKAGCQSGNCFFTRHNNADSSLKAAQSHQVRSAEMLITKNLFEKVFPKRIAFYTYRAFRSAVGTFPEFGTTGSPAAQKREVAAFLAHVYQETAGLTEITEVSYSSSSSAETFCVESSASAKTWSCFPGKKYFARGPLKLTWNYNYEKASAALGVDLLAKPEQVTENPELAFKSALWVWMSSLDENRPSAHEVMTGSWSPSQDVSDRRVNGFGTTIAVLVGRAECGHESDAATARIEKYVQVAKMLDVNAGSNLDCASMLSF